MRGEVWLLPLPDELVEIHQSRAQTSSANFSSPFLMNEVGHLTLHRAARSVRADCCQSSPSPPPRPHRSPYSIHRLSGTLPPPLSLCTKRGPEIRVRARRDHNSRTLRPMKMRLLPVATTPSNTRRLLAVQEQPLSVCLPCRAAGCVL